MEPTNSSNAGFIEDMQIRSEMLRGLVKSAKQKKLSISKDN